MVELSLFASVESNSLTTGRETERLAYNSHNLRIFAPLSRVDAILPGLRSDIRFRDNIFAYHHTQQTEILESRIAMPTDIIRRSHHSFLTSSRIQHRTFTGLIRATHTSYSSDLRPEIGQIFGFYRPTSILLPINSTKRSITTICENKGMIQLYTAVI